MIHKIENKPQPIAQQIMVQCSCGWRDVVFVFQYEQHNELWDEVKRLRLEHMNGLTTTDVEQR